MKDILCALEDVTVRYEGITALDRVSFSVDEGEIVALMGPNGAGKSTILKILFGMERLSEGEVLWHGSRIEPVPHKMAERGIAFVPQGRRVFPNLTVEENLEMGGFMVRDKKELSRRVGESFELFPVLKRKRMMKSGALSGGEQQMVALARGLMVDPKALFLDEPSLGLAPKIVKEIFAKIKEINERHKTAIVIVEHNIASLLAIADRAYVLDKGAVAWTGSADKIKESAILEKVFLGKV
ncbi:ABC transporter ATP-binding protein [bacterium]|nr:ABC transporter ATP-binding protein [bacterium]MCI0566443.1 ABC transporter ATP-binding protein [bacterium]MCI0680281.1 ABC transporter ATP-binding protein [bacterium]